MTAGNFTGGGEAQANPMDYLSAGGLKDILGGNTLDAAAAAGAGAASGGGDLGAEGGASAAAGAEEGAEGKVASAEGGKDAAKQGIGRRLSCLLRLFSLL